MVPTGSPLVAEVLVGREREVDGGWSYDVMVKRGEERTEHCVRLAWVDYEYWSHGASAPERVVKAVVEAMLALGPGTPLPERFDAAASRQRVRGVDERVRDMLRGMGEG